MRRPRAGKAEGPSGWLTPTAGDAEGPESPEKVLDRRDNVGRLKDQAQFAKEVTCAKNQDGPVYAVYVPAGWNTPAATDVKGGFWGGANEERQTVGGPSGPDGATRGTPRSEAGREEPSSDAPHGGPDGCGSADPGRDPGDGGDGTCGEDDPRGTSGERPDPRNPWADARWLYCRDGKIRPTQPDIFPLADGFPERVGLLRGYGNAIVPQVAAVFIGAYMEWDEFCKSREENRG